MFNVWCFNWCWTENTLFVSRNEYLDMSRYRTAFTFKLKGRVRIRIFKYGEKLNEQPVNDIYIYIYIWGWGYTGIRLQSYVPANVTCHITNVHWCKKDGHPKYLCLNVRMSKTSIAFFTISPGSKDLISLMAKRWWLKLIEKVSSALLIKNEKYSILKKYGITNDFDQNDFFNIMMNRNI